MRNLRLEWIEAGSLSENPANWRKHSPEQLQSIKDLIQDPDVGWAGACLFNEKTGRLIDGHARKEVTDPKELVPVLVGSWSEEAERKILATLDPVGVMAQGDPTAFAALVESITAESLWVRDLLHNTQAGLNAAGEDEDDPAEEPSAVLPQMECQPFEHHDYIMLLFHHEQDFQQACERLGIGKVEIQYPGGRSKVGLGRCVDGAKAMRMLVEANSNTTVHPNVAGVEALQSVPATVADDSVGDSLGVGRHDHRRTVDQGTSRPVLHDNPERKRQG